MLLNYRRGITYIFVHHFVILSYFTQKITRNCFLIPQGNVGKSQPDIPRQRHAYVQPAKGVQVRPRTECRFRRRYCRCTQHPDVGELYTYIIPPTSVLLITKPSHHKQYINITVVTVVYYSQPRHRANTPPGSWDWPWPASWTFLKWNRSSRWVSVNCCGVTKIHF